MFLQNRSSRGHLHVLQSGQLPFLGANVQRYRVGLTLLLWGWLSVGLSPSLALGLDLGQVIQPLPDLDGGRAQAQAIATSHAALRSFVLDPRSGEPLRVEVFGVYPARASDLPAGESCGEAGCYRVDIYNFARNETYSIITDPARAAVVSDAVQPGAQADLPPHLVQRAIDIAAKDPLVVAMVGERSEAPEPVMANVKTALNQSSCERSRHLCVAPTFVIRDTALWAIVDLTSEELVGVQWTELGGEPVGVVTEESIKTEQVFERYCKDFTHLERGDWSLDYILTSSDGLQVSDLRFQGRTVLRSAKLVDWHVSYSSKAGFGYSDAVGCPKFSSASVIAYGGPEIEPMLEADREVGFALVQDFRQIGWPMPCRYRYRQRFELYDDGRFRVMGANIGRGCGVDGTYRPVLRLELAGDGGQTLSRWSGTDWEAVDKETWMQQDDLAWTPDGQALRVVDAGGRGHTLAPARGQFNDGGRGDHAYLYATRARPEEGGADMVTIGPCCNTDHHQGPEKFIAPQAEDIRGKDTVLWYVAQLHNSGNPGAEHCWADSVLDNGVYVPRTWPCYFGPMFTPLPAP
jgi:hypothetical protein